MEPQVGKNRIIAEFRASPRGLRWPPPSRAWAGAVLGCFADKSLRANSGQDCWTRQSSGFTGAEYIKLELYSAVPNALVTQNIRPGSKVEAGLGNRRQDEAYLWVTGIYRAHGHVIP